MTVYLSGPITGVSDYKERFAKAQGYIEHLAPVEVINPASYLDRPTWTWADWMLFDLHLLTKAHVLVSLSGSDESKGARVERDFALGLGIPVLDLADFRAWAATISKWRPD
jgi:hypothetical protein